MIKNEEQQNKKDKGEYRNFKQIVKNFYNEEIEKIKEEK